MDIRIRHVLDEDGVFWFKLDRHLSEAEFNRKVKDHRAYVLLENNSPVGILRYNLFWDNVPFCTMLVVELDYQKKGYGKRLMMHWEMDMKAGGLLLNIPGYEQPMELFLVKAI